MEHINYKLIDNNEKNDNDLNKLNNISESDKLKLDKIDDSEVLLKNFSLDSTNKDELKQNIIKKKRHEGKRHFVLTEPLLEFRRNNGELKEQIDKYGNFYGKTPYEAARKAANSIYESKILEGKFTLNQEKMNFGLKEISKNKNNKNKEKIYNYELTREYLQKPIEVKLKNGESYKIHFSTKIKSI